MHLHGCHKALMQVTDFKEIHTVYHFEMHAPQLKFSRLEVVNFIRRNIAISCYLLMQATPDFLAWYC